ncbi:MAG: hypothetical protein ACRCTY_01950, partial [Candidatus Adiutrix sp.]
DRQPLGSWRDIPARLRSQENLGTFRKRALFGPAIFHRLSMEEAISHLEVSSRPVPLATGLVEINQTLANIPGRKILLVFSEFLGKPRSQDVARALGRLRAEHQSSLNALFIYGDTDGQGYALAHEAARGFGTTPWDSCLLLNDNAYFERFIRAMFN